MVIALGRSRKGNLFSVADIFWGKKTELFVRLSMPLSLLELAWLDIWPGQAWLVIFSYLAWMCQLVVIARSVPTPIPPPSRLNLISIPSQFHFHSSHLYAHSDFRFRPHSRSLVAPVFVPIPAPAPWSLRFSLPWLGLGWLGPGRGPSRRCVLAAPFREAISLAKRYRFAVYF